MRHTLLFLMMMGWALAVLPQEMSKKFAIHFRTMEGTADEVRFSQNGTLDEWATGDNYYTTKDLSQIKSITRYFPVSALQFSRADLVMKPGEECLIDITFTPRDAVVQYVDKNVYSTNSNVAKATRQRGAQLKVQAVSAGECTLTVHHSEAGDRHIHVQVQPDEAYVDHIVDSLLALMTDDEKFAYVGGTNWYYIRDIARLDIPKMRMCDGPNGVCDGHSTTYPPDVTLAACWNKSLAQRMGRSLGRDSRARGLNFILGPAVNIYRAPFCGRNFEYMGEDPYLASQTAVNYIKGVQSQGVSTVVKHFICNNSDYDRDHISNDMDERTMHEIYLPTFKAAVQEAKTGALMTSYNLTHGVYTTHDHHLLTDILRTKWGFKGICMSDWGSTHDGLAAALAGLDLEMASGDNMSPANLRQYIKEGKMTMDVVDLKVRHILHTIVSMGFLDGMQTDTRIPLDDPSSDSTALQVAREGMVLLKNEHEILPIDPDKHRRIVVTGKNATGFVSGGGSSNATPIHYVSFLDGIRAMAWEMGAEVEYRDQLDFLPAIMYADEECTEHGLKAEYFDNIDFNGAPVYSATEQKISHIWTATGPEVGGLTKENYAVRWSGYIRVDKSASYTFNVGADDGFRLTIDGTVVADGWTAGSYHSKTYSKSLSPTKTYRVQLEYYQKGGAAQIDFTWKKRTDTTDYLAEYLKDCDLVVACIGYNSSKEGEGSDRSFDLPSEDKELLQSISKSGVPTVAVVTGGGAVEMQSWQADVDAILWAFYGGQNGGQALGELLFGKENPSGHLPMTFERMWSENPTYNSYHDPDGDKHVAYSEGIFVGYRGYDKLGREVQYPFGHGLSYTTFEMSDISVSSQQADGSVEVSCTLSNTGRWDGTQVVQLYVGRENGTVERPLRELKGYEKVLVRAGDRQHVTIRVPREAFTYYSVEADDFVYDPGTYRIDLGFSSRDIRKSLKIEMK